jgi:multiple sugar transport system ATP-binding protein
MLSKSRDVKKAYGTAQVLHGVSRDIPDLQFGRPFRGKSTMLRMVAGLEGIASSRPSRV